MQDNKECIFDDKYIERVDAADRWDKAWGLLSLYRIEVYFKNGFDPTDRYIDHDHKRNPLYDDRRMEYVKDKLIKRYGSIETAIEQHKKETHEEWQRIFPNGMLGVVKADNEETEKYNFFGPLV